MFSPIVLAADTASWTGGAEPEREAMRRRVVLADGGVYDNMGLEELTGSHDEDGSPRGDITVLVSARTILELIVTACRPLIF